MMWNDFEVDVDYLMEQLDQRDEEIFQLQKEKECLSAMLNGEEVEEDDQELERSNVMEQRSKRLWEENKKLQGEQKKLQEENWKLKEENEKHERKIKELQEEKQTLQNNSRLMERLMKMERYVKKLLEEKERSFSQAHSNINRIRILEEELLLAKEQNNNKSNRQKDEEVDFLKEQLSIRDQEVQRLHDEHEQSLSDALNMEEQLPDKQTELQQREEEE